MKHEIQPEELSKPGVYRYKGDQKGGESTTYSTHQIEHTSLFGVPIFGWVEIGSGWVRRRMCVVIWAEPGIAVAVPFYWP